MNLRFLRTFVAQFCQIEKVLAEVMDLRIELDPTVTFDRSHLNQVMWNLCRNAPSSPLSPRVTT